ncbi:hypothetical protein DZC31_19880 [Stenotrophomonas rhizophila]|nr:hypothetical protein DZC31_19880 [Stenotrophomonas rhizophila]
MHQGGPCWLHRSDWPETDVGAAVRRSDLPAMRRAGGARSLYHHKSHGMDLFLHPATLYLTARAKSSAILRRTQFEIVARLKPSDRHLIYPAVSNNSSVRRT